MRNEPSEEGGLYSKELNNKHGFHFYKNVLINTIYHMKFGPCYPKRPPEQMYNMYSIPVVNELRLLYFFSSL